MNVEGSAYDRKSLRAVTGSTADWDELAKDAVAFSNARGGVIDIGIEDAATEPPPGQAIDDALADRVRRRIRELTVNVDALPDIVEAANGGRFLRLQVTRSVAIASTTQGRYFVRVGDSSEPVVGDDVLRLIDERASLPWETLTHQQVPRERADADQLGALLAGLRGSDRVKDAVKLKADDELLDHYLLADGPWLTNLGVLCLGRAADRARLGTAPAVQAIRYDDTGAKINKWSWDDHLLSPMALVDAVWRGLPDFRESYELPAGLLRESVPAYDERVVRELLVNALVHRPYTQRGDIYLNLHPDRLEVVNPGRLPVGVTPANLLHKSVRRNDQLARLFHDLKLMEREGTGVDLVYETLLSQGRPAPRFEEREDSVHVVVQRRIVRPEVIGFLARADASYQLGPRERICLGLLVQGDGMSAAALAQALSLTGTDAVQGWIGRLRELGLVDASRKTKGTRYFVAPAVLAALAFKAPTTLARIEPHRLEALVVEDLRRWPGSPIGQIHERIGPEIARSQVKAALDRLAAASPSLVHKAGDRKWRRYWAVD